MIEFDDFIKEETKEHNPNWPEIPNHQYRILIIGGSGSGKTNSLFNLINQQPDIDRIYLQAKDLNQARYQFLNKTPEDVGKKYFTDSKAFTEWSNDMKHIYKNIKEYNLNKKRKILTAYDDMIADMLNIQKNNPIVTELFKTKHFSCFCYTILFCCAKKYQTIFNALFCYKNSKQKRTSTNCI